MRKEKRKVYYCPNCYINPEIDWQRLNKELDDMIKDGKKKKKI
jgi:hypothetical protein